MFAKWRDNIEVSSIKYCYVISQGLSNRYDLSFVTYVDRNNRCYFLSCWTLGVIEIFKDVVVALSILRNSVLIHTFGVPCGKKNLYTDCILRMSAAQSATSRTGLLENIWPPAVFERE